MTRLWVYDLNYSTLTQPKIVIFALAVLQLRSYFDVVVDVQRIFQREHLYVALQRVHALPEKQDGHIDRQQKYHDRIHFPRLQGFL